MRLRQLFGSNREDQRANFIQIMAFIILPVVAMLAMVITVLLG